MTTHKQKTLLLNSADNVALALSEIAQGESTGDDSLLLAREKIPAGHKIAVKKIDAGQSIVKYGQIIGFASETIESGSHVHTHNVEEAVPNPLIFYPKLNRPPLTA
jgi:altronate hydrolase